VVTESFPG